MHTCMRVVASGFGSSVFFLLVCALPCMTGSSSAADRGADLPVLSQLVFLGPSSALLPRKSDDDHSERRFLHEKPPAPGDIVFVNCSTAATFLLPARGKSGHQSELVLLGMVRIQICYRNKQYFVITD